MAYETIDINTIKVGDPITKDLFDLIRSNFEDHETRINQAETTGGAVFILDSAFHLANFTPDEPDIFYYKATQDFEIIDFRLQIFAKGTVTSGTLSFDLQKSTDTDNANFNTVLTADVSFNFASDADYLEKVATLNPSLTAINAGEVLRVVVTGIPTGFKDKILIFVGGEYCLQDHL